MGWFASVHPFVWTAISACAAVVFAIIRPSTILSRLHPGHRAFIVRWFHSLVWALLAVSFAIRPASSSLANLVALLAAAAYVVFLGALLLPA